MPVLDYRPYPSVEPTARAMPPQSIEGATPQAFGAGIGASLERLGTAFGEGADKLANVTIARQQIYNQIATDEQVNNFQDRANKLMYGDPDVPGDTGYLGRQGKDAADRFPEFQRNLTNLMNEHRGVLQNPIQQHAFDQAVRRSRAIMMSEAGRHYDREFQRYGQSVAHGQQTLAQQDMARTAAQGNYELAKEALARAMDGATKLAQAKGLSPEDQEAARRAEGGKFVQIWADSLGVKDPEGALKFVEENKDLITDPNEYQRINTELRARALRAQGDRILSRQPAPQGGPLVRGGALPEAPVAPAEYQPMIEGAASKYNVPSELLTRLLAAESGFNPNAVGPPNRSGQLAQGIAQFLPSTAAQYGINPRDPAQAIEGAAHYLSDLYGRAGSWNGALKGYLGGDPHNAASYNKHGVGQLADALDQQGVRVQPTASVTMGPNPIQQGAPGGTVSVPPPAPVGDMTQPAPPPPGGPAARAVPGAANQVTAIGDSLTAHLTRFGGASGQEDRTAVGSWRPGDTSVSGWDPGQVRWLIDQVPDERIRGQNIAFSSGISNDRDKTKEEIEHDLSVTIPDQIDALKARNAGNIVLMGVGNHPNLAGVNDRLAQIAQAKSVGFSGPIKAGTDQIHFGRVGAAGAMQQVLGAFGQAPVAKPPDQLVGQRPLNLPPPDPGQLPDDQIPGLLPKLQSLLNNPEVQKNPDLREYVIKKARQDANMLWAQQQHQRTAAEQVQKDKDEKWKYYYQQRMAPDSQDPIDPNEIYHNDDMSAEAKNTVLGWYQTAVKPPIDSKISAQNQRKLYEKITNGELKDVYEIENAYNSSDPNVQINWAHREQLINKFNDLKGEREKDWEKQFKGVMGIVEAKIMPTLAAMPREMAYGADPNGAERVLRWQQAVEARKSDLRKEGKNPMVLLQPGTADKPNPDYVGNESFWKGAAGEPAVPTPPPTNAPNIDLTTLDGLRRAIQAYPARRDEFIAEGIKRGLLRANPPTAPTVQAPLR